MRKSWWRLKSNKMIKIVFFGSSSYCLPILESLNENFSLAAIVTKPHGFVNDFASKNHITVFTPQDKQEFLSLKEKLKSLHPDLTIVADFGMIIPPEIFLIPRYKTLNIHFSKLPDLRGASPVQFTILRGDKSAWISVIIMDEGLDTGDIIWQREALQGHPLRGYMAEDLYKKLFNIVSADLPSVINQYVKNEIKPRKQNHRQATYTRPLTRSDGFIPLQTLQQAITKPFARGPLANAVIWPTDSLLQPIAEKLPLPQLLERAVRAFTPFPGLWTEIKLPAKTTGDQTTSGVTRRGSPDGEGIKKRLKILKVHIKDNKLVLDLVQLEGKKPVTWKQFRQGYPDVFSTI